MMNSPILPEVDPWQNFWTLIFNAARELDRREPSPADTAASPGPRYPVPQPREERK